MITLGIMELYLDAKVLCYYDMWNGLDLDMYLLDLLGVIDHISLLHGAPFNPSFAGKMDFR